MPWKFNPFTGKLSEVGTSGNAVATQDIISDGNMSIMTYDGTMKYVNRTTIEPSSGNIITEGNITADSFIGDGSQLTGLTGGGGVDRLTNGENELILESTGTLTLPLGGTIGETATTLVLTPPTALTGQGLVIRTTVGGGLSTTDTFTPGGSVTVTFTDNGSHLSTGGYVDDSESNTWAYTITGISEADLGSPLTGSFLAENWGTPNISQNAITFNIPAESEGTGFTITLDKIITDPPYYLQDIFGINEDGRIALTIGSVPEISHVHLTTADPITVDLYLGDDDQYVKIKKNGSGVVVGTNTNTHRWTFGTDGTLTFPDNTTQTTAYKGIPGPYADDAAAAADGVAVGSPYHKTGTNGQVFVRFGLT
jgi:hypothetical protein